MSTRWSNSLVFTEPSTDGSIFLHCEPSLAPPNYLSIKGLFYTQECRPHKPPARNMAKSSTKLLLPDPGVRRIRSGWIKGIDLHRRRDCSSIGGNRHIDDRHCKGTDLRHDRQYGEHQAIITGKVDGKPFRGSRRRCKNHGIRCARAPSLDSVHGADVDR